MNGFRICLFGAVAALAVLALSACGGKTTVNNQPAETSGITVSGHGEVDVPPDIGFVTVGVQSTASTVADAREAAAQSADALVSSLKKNGVAEKDIQTTGLYIQPNYDYSKSTPRLTGYTVTNTVTAKVRKIDSMSKVVDDAVTAGGDSARLQGISFGVEDSDKAKQDAREKAMANAKAKAEALAKLGEVTLGKPVTIAETQGSTTVPSVDKGAGDYQSGGSSTPIQAGTNKVSVDVTVRWAIE